MFSPFDFGLKSRILVTAALLAVVPIPSRAQETLPPSGTRWQEYYAAAETLVVPDEGGFEGDADHRSFEVQSVERSWQWSCETVRDRDGVGLSARVVLTDQRDLSSSSDGTALEDRSVDVAGRRLVLARKASGWAVSAWDGEEPLEGETKRRVEEAVLHTAPADAGMLPAGRALPAGEWRVDGAAVLALYRMDLGGSGAPPQAEALLRVRGEGPGGVEIDITFRVESADAGGTQVRTGTGRIVYDRARGLISAYRFAGEVIHEVKGEGGVLPVRGTWSCRGARTFED